MDERFGLIRHQDHKCVCLRQKVEIRFFWVSFIRNGIYFVSESNSELMLFLARGGWTLIYCLRFHTMIGEICCIKLQIQAGGSHALARYELK